MDAGEIRRKDLKTDAGKQEVNRKSTPGKPAIKTGAGDHPGVLYKKRRRFYDVELRIYSTGK